MQDPPIVELTELPHPARSVRWGPWKAQPSAGTAIKRLKLLMLHGFGGSPGEMRPLGRALLRRGFTLQAPLLPGHGENLEAMREILLADWLEAVTLSYESMRRDDRPVAIVGFCLGGALALRLAGQLNPRALVCLATPARPLADAAFPGTTGLRSNLKNINDSSSAEVCRWRNLGCHQMVPEAFFAQYQQLLSTLGPALGEVRCPILVAQSRKDKIVEASDAEYLVETVSSQRRKLVWSRRAGHALPVDVGRRALFAEIISFLEEEDLASAPNFGPRP
jgi:carboxylesterase